MTRYIKPRKLVNIRTDMEPHFKKEHVADDEKGPRSFFGRKPPTTSLDYDDLFEGKTGEDVKPKGAIDEKDKPRGKDGNSNQSRTTPMDGKKYSNLDVTTVEVEKQVMSKINEIKDMVSKAPPIFNPTARREEEREKPNDDLEGRALEELFEKIIDPKIKQGSDNDVVGVNIDIRDLKMSRDVALEKIKEAYGELGYQDIRNNTYDKNLIVIELK
jgi:hypothetical protein